MIHIHRPHHQTRRRGLTLTDTCTCGAYRHTVTLTDPRIAVQPVTVRHPWTGGRPGWTYLGLALRLAILMAALTWALTGIIR